jgi:hypothetical protein
MESTKGPTENPETLKKQIEVVPDHADNEE